MTTDSEFTFEWLEEQKYPLVNKFYSEHRLRGKARGGDQCAIVRLNGEIIGSALLRPVDDCVLLTAMAIAPVYRHMGIGTRLLGFMQERFNKNIFSFPYKHLESFYRANGFELCPSDCTPEILLSRYEAYMAQGRSILLMNYQRIP